MPLGLPQRFSLGFGGTFSVEMLAPVRPCVGACLWKTYTQKIKKNSDSHLFEAAFIPPTRCQILPYVCLNTRPVSGIIRRDLTKAKLSNSCSAVLVCAQGQHARC